MTENQGCIAPWVHHRSAGCIGFKIKKVLLYKKKVSLNAISVEGFNRVSLSKPL